MSAAPFVEAPGGRPPKAAWPVFALASTGFIPGLGIFTGLAAIIWGLLANRPRALWAAGLGALAMLGQFALLIGLAGGFQHSEAFRSAQIDVTRKDLVKVVIALEDWHDRNHAYPARLEALIGTPLPVNMVNIFDHSAGIFRLPHTYQYEVAPDGLSYDVFAVGPDARPGTDDDIRPDLPDSLRARSGYQP